MDNNLRNLKGGNRHTFSVKDAIVRAVKWFCLWHVDGAIRYSTAVRLIRQYGTCTTKILEVGSGSMGLSLFLSRPLIGFDIYHDGVDLGLLTPVKPISCDFQIPFQDHEFDFVISMDMLEHVPAPHRLTILQEMIRVSRQWVILTVPCGLISIEYDAKLYEWCKYRLGLDYRWLKEHLDLCLPDSAEVENMIRECIENDKKWKLTIEDNFNVDTWLWVWKFTMSKNRVWRSLNNKLLWPLMPYLLRQNNPPAYRKVFILRHVLPQTELEFSSV